MSATTKKKSKSRVQGGGWASGAKPASKPRAQRATAAAAADSDPAPETNLDADTVAPLTYTPTAIENRLSSNYRVKTFQDGLVYLEGVIPLSLQQKLVDLCIHYGTGKEEGINSFYEGKVTTELGFYDPSNPNTDASLLLTQAIPYKGSAAVASSAAPATSEPPTPESDAAGAKKLNMLTKARLNIPINKHPAEFVALAKQFLHLARAECPSIPDIDPTIVRVNYYTHKGRIGWHYDRVPGLSPEEQKTVTSPVISLSLGDSADFMFKEVLGERSSSSSSSSSRDEGEGNKVVLKSGDVIVFGGPSRMIYHSVPKIHKNTSPEALNLGQFSRGRFNISYFC